jgi:hypothetical protein
VKWSSIKAQIADRLFGDVIQQQVSARVQQAIAAPFGLADPSLYGFRRLTGRENQAALRDLPMPTHERMQDIAYWLYLANPMAQWFVNQQTAYVIGSGVTLQTKDESLKQVLDRFWHDPISRWPSRLVKKTRELGMYGEQCWPCFVSPGTGLVRVGYLDPCLIEEVILDPDNAELAIGVVTKSNYQGTRAEQRRYRTALAVPEDELLPSAQQERSKLTDGDCFYFAVNHVSNGSRGWSDLLCKADWMDGYEQFLFQRLERADLANRVVTDVEMTGANDEQIKAYMKAFQLPPPGGAFIHNDKIKLEHKAVDLQASDASMDARMFKHQCINPMPEHWYGGGGDVNRATASEMDESTFKLFEMRQGEVKAIIAEVVGYQILRAKEAGGLPQALKPEWQAVFPEMVKADITKHTTAMSSTATANTSMLSQGVIDKGEARKIYAVVVKPLGIELEEKTNEELEQAAAERDLNDASADYRDNPQEPVVKREAGEGHSARPTNDQRRETRDEGADA